MNPMTLYRAGRWLTRLRIPLLPRCVYVLTYVVFHCSIPLSAEIGEGTTFAYGGLGVLLHPRCRIGRNVTIAPHVIIGGRSGRPELPVIEDGCYIGVGAMVLGPVRVGAGAVVGASAVVLHDVAPGAVVAGIPARPIRSRRGVAMVC